MREGIWAWRDADVNLQRNDTALHRFNAEKGGARKRRISLNHLKATA
jgi:hypothetical protein